MYVLTIVMLMSWLALQMVSLSDSYNYVASLYRDQADDIQFENLKTDIDRYFDRYGDTPASLSALQTDDLFIHTKSHDEPWIVYRKQSGLTDDRFTYERTGFAFIDKTRFNPWVIRLSSFQRNGIVVLQLISPVLVHGAVIPKYLGDVSSHAKL